MVSPASQATDHSSFIFSQDFSPHWLLAYKQLLVGALLLTYYLVDSSLQKLSLLNGVLFTGGSENEGYILRQQKKCFRYNVIINIV
jgi:hypothetical protein